VKIFAFFYIIFISHVFSFLRLVSLL